MTPTPLAYDVLGFPIYPPCELHGEAQCLTCYHEPGQCTHGACQADAVWRRTYAHKRTGIVYEVRDVCKLHNDRLDEGPDHGRGDLASVTPINP